MQEASTHDPAAQPAAPGDVTQGTGPAVMFEGDDGLHCSGACGGTVDSETGERNDDEGDCRHCECCCECLGCEYGPRNGLGMTDEQRAPALAIAENGQRAGAEAGAPAVEPAPAVLPAPAVPPGDAANALHAFIVPGLARAGGLARTNATPQALAVMFADLAARLAVLELPAGHGLSITIDVQPDIPTKIRGADREAAEVAVVDAASAVLAPGVEPCRQIMTGGSIHHVTRATTPAGLHLDVYTGVKPTEYEAAFIAEVRARRAES